MSYEYHPDELITPEWMDFQFFESMLANSYGDKHIKVKNVDVIPACPLGDHYASLVYRAKVIYATGKDGKTKETSIIIKTTFNQNKDGVLKEILNSNRIFETEISMYSKVLPEMDRLLEVAGYKNVLMSPKMMYHSLTSSKSIIAFNDLRQYGYVSDHKMLDFHGSKIVAEKLGKFHALSYYMNQNNTKLSEYKHGTFNKGVIDASKIMFDTIRIFTSEISTWPGMEMFSDNLYECNAVIPAKCEKLYTVNPNGINVLNHGDFHRNNLLFKYNEHGDIIDIIFIDYQACVWGSPAIDLIGFLYGIASIETRDNYRDELIYLYYKQFSSTLQQLGFIGSSPTLLDLHVELMKNGFYEMFMTTTMMVFCNVDLRLLDTNVLFGSSPETEELKKNLIRKPIFKEVISKYIPSFVYKGFI